MQNFMIEWNGQKVSYFEAGDRQNPTIVCLHGLAGSAAYIFLELSKKLSTQFHLLLIDQLEEVSSEIMKWVNHILI